MARNRTHSERQQVADSCSSEQVERATGPPVVRRGQLPRWMLEVVTSE